MRESDEDRAARVIGADIVGLHALLVEKLTDGSDESDIVDEVTGNASIYDINRCSYSITVLLRSGDRVKITLRELKPERRAYEHTRD